MYTSRNSNAHCDTVDTVTPPVVDRTARSARCATSDWRLEAEETGVDGRGRVRMSQVLGGVGRSCWEFGSQGSREVKEPGAPLVEVFGGLGYP